MGLDLVVESCPKPGHEAEWRQILQRSFDEEASDGDRDRFQEISIPPHERLGAPRVGYDEAADAWIIEASGVSSPEEVAAVLKDFHGYHAVRLVECDGVPEYSHGGLYEGVDETSFRGAFLKDCGDVLPGTLIDEAWAHKFPEEAISYGEALLAASAAAREPAAEPPEKKGWSLFGLGGRKKEAGSLPFEEQQNIVQAAGKWFIFWGKRGHAIRAWF